MSSFYQGLDLKVQSYCWRSRIFLLLHKKQFFNLIEYIYAASMYTFSIFIYSLRKCFFFSNPEDYFSKTWICFLRI